MSVSALVRPPLLAEVRRLIAQVRVSGAPTHGTPVELGDGLPAVRVSVRPASSSIGAFHVISFTEHTDLLPANELADSGSTEAVRLQRELDSTRETLQATIEELETSNEELQAMNEEMMASTEELQASNEEPGTLNEELQVRSRELADANRDLRNIQAAISQALVLVDERKRITRYSPLAVRLFALVEEDLGVPIGRIATTMPCRTWMVRWTARWRAGDRRVGGAQPGRGLPGGGVGVARRARPRRRRRALHQRCHPQRAGRRETARIDEELGLVTGQLRVAAWTRRVPDGALLSIGEEAGPLLGVPVEVLQADRDSWLAHVVPEDRDVAARSSAPDRDRRLQYRTSIDGQERTILDVELGPLGSSPSERFGMLQDITDSAEAVMSRASELALTTAAFDLPGRLLLRVDTAGRIARVSPGAEAFLGIADELVIGRRLGDICVPGDREALDRWLGRWAAVRGTSRDRLRRPRRGVATALAGGDVDRHQLGSGCAGGRVRPHPGSGRDRPPAPAQPNRLADRPGEPHGDDPRHAGRDGPRHA